MQFINRDRELIEKIASRSLEVNHSFDCIMHRARWCGLFEARRAIAKTSQPLSRRSSESHTRSS